MQSEQFGLELGEKFDIASIGPVACAMAASSTLREAISVLGQFHRLTIDSLIEVNTSGEGGEISVELVFPEIDRVHIRQFSDFFAAGMIATFSRLVCKPVSPAHVALPYENSGDSCHHQKALGGLVSFGDERLRIVLSAENADSQIPSRDNALRAAVLKYCDGLLNSRSHYGNAFIRELERLTLELLPVNQAKAKIVATNLGVSELTLQRRLAEANRTFSTFVDNLRHELALEHLQADEISLGEIAFVLGYGSQSAFQTAFKRWTGQTPSQYRKKIRTGSHLV
ncbi:MAG: helix-turn-helix domain-containing protein [Hyphomicrobiales bacterium]